MFNPFRTKATVPPEEPRQTVAARMRLLADRFYQNVPDKTQEVLKEALSMIEFVAQEGKYEWPILEEKLRFADRNKLEDALREMDFTVSRSLTGSLKVSWK